MRLFVGVEIMPHVRTAAGALIDELRQRALRLAPRSRITWITADRLHVTVRFIGHVGEEQAAAIQALLTLRPPVDPFNLTAAGVGAFPPQGPPRVVWSGLTDGVDHLIAVERHVTGLLTQTAIKPDDRPFAAHLTLGRVRDAAGLRRAALLEGVSDTVLGTTRVDAITLFESRLSPKGPTYVPLLRTAL